MSLDFGRNPGGDPVKACQAERDRLLKDGSLPSYQEIGITLQPLAIRAAEWEYTYQPGSVRMHSATRWFVNSGRAFALGWTTRDFDWSQNWPAYRMVQGTFTGSV
jgi:eukaryotic-like serine/threonine-protein kinase